MKKWYTLLFALMVMNITMIAFAGCGSDKQQALSIIQTLKSKPDQANAMSEQLAKLVDSLSNQSCTSELLDVYRTMQREGIQAN